MAEKSKEYTREEVLQFLKFIRNTCAEKDQINNGCGECIFITNHGMCLFSDDTYDAYSSPEDWRFVDEASDVFVF